MHDLGRCERPCEGVPRSLEIVDQVIARNTNYFSAIRDHMIAMRIAPTAERQTSR
jgi:hypothetical protein